MRKLFYLFSLVLLSASAFGQTQIGTNQIRDAAVTGAKLGSMTSAQLRSAASDESGNGALLFQNGALGTPISGTATNLTGLPISTGVSGLGTGVSGALGNNANASGGVATTDGTATLTNKRINPRVQTVTSSATVTANADTDDLVDITAQAAGLTLANPTGTPVSGQVILYRWKDNGTARSITWGSNFQALGITLPASTVISKWAYACAIWNPTSGKWDVTNYTIQQ